MSGTINATIGNGGLEQQSVPQPAYDTRAILRALRLLWKHLTPEQRGQYKLYLPTVEHEGRSFIVRGNLTGAHYRIFQNGSVIRLRDNHRLCLMITEPVPPADVMLAKKLLLETDEELFLEVANDLTDRAAIFARQGAMELGSERIVVEIRSRRALGFFNRLLRS